MLKRGSDSPALSLSLSPRHSDILTFYGIMSKIGEPKVRFLSLSSLQTSRSGVLLAESALFTLPLLLFAADKGSIPARHCFFFSLCAFCHLADLFRSFSPAFLIKRAFSGPGRTFPRTSTRRPRSPATSSSKHAASILGRVLKLELAAL
jgi:hypothetical protein